jgi:NAD(P)-dependent dehydrogenase (short-subunit alcohol dehydrogenase family)
VQSHETHCRRLSRTVPYDIDEDNTSDNDNCDRTTITTLSPPTMMEELYAPLGLAAVFALLAGIFDNHVWRLFLIVGLNVVSSLSSPLESSSSLMGWVIGTSIHVGTTMMIWWMPHLVNLKLNQREGCVLISGCDSGMGQATVVYLAQSNTSKNKNAKDTNEKKGYDQIFAACYNAKASQTYFETELTPEQMKSVTVVPLDVTNDKSVQQAAKVVEDWMTTNSNSSRIGLTGVVLYHGIALTGPAQYMPIEMYQRQLDVNFVGNLRVVQAFLPILKKRSSKAGRLVFTGTGGGSCSPCPPLLTAYMASKFATEGYCQALRQELYMTSTGIDAIVINPGFVKPTMLMEEGKKLTEQMWRQCEKNQGSTVAKDEFGPLLDHFTHYSALQPGTHVSEVCKAAEHALLAPVPRSSYKVGIDSKLAPIVGLMPTGMRETITRHGIYGVLSPAGTVKDYQM